MSPAPENEVSALIEAHADGDPTALDRLLPLVYDELRALASHALRRTGPGHTLQSTALAHEAWLKLSRGLRDVGGQQHFLAVASRAMRQVLSDYARRARAAKRGAGAVAVTLSESLDGAAANTFDIVALDDSLERLSQLRPRHARIVELRFFGGLTIAETAAALGVSTGTVESDWAMARAWLGRELRVD